MFASEDGGPLVVRRRREGFFVAESDLHTFRPVRP
jgi:hypothetical protein